MANLYTLYLYTLAQIIMESPLPKHIFFQLSLAIHFYISIRL